MVRRFRHAFNGLKSALLDDRSVRLHFVTAGLVLVIGYVACIKFIDWAVIFFTVSFVIVTELINSSIETFADHVHPEQHEDIKKIKDLAAAAVLIAAFCTVIIGIIIFLPPILRGTAGTCLI